MLISLKGDKISKFQVHIWNQWEILEDLLSYQKTPFENFAIYGLRLRHHEFFLMDHYMSCTWLGRSKMM